MAVVPDSEVLEALERRSPFASLSREALSAIASRLRPRFARAGETVIREGEEGDCFYLVRSGRLEVLHGSRRVALLRVGDSFGEVALFMQARRNATVRAIEESELLELSRHDFLSMVHQHRPAGDFLREMVHIRFRGARGPHLPVPDPVAALMPLAAARRRKRYWVVLLAGVVMFAMLTAAAEASGQRAWLYAVLATGSSIGPVVFVMYLAESNILSERPFELVATALLGAALGLPPAIALQREAGTIPGDLMPALLVALIEEPAKVLGVVWVLRRPALRFRMDGLIYGAAAGMGFAALETALYSLARINSVGVVLGVLWLRALLSPFSHGTWTAIVCATIWSERFVGWRRGCPRILAAFGAVVLLHAFWDWRPLPLPWNFVWLVAFAATSLVALRLVLRHAQREEARSVLAVAPEIARSAPVGPRLTCPGCRRTAPAGAHYCPRCGLALWPTDQKTGRHR